MKLAFTYCPESKEDQLFEVWLNEIKNRLQHLASQKIAEKDISFHSYTSTEDIIGLEFDLHVVVITECTNTANWLSETLNHISENKFLSVVLKKDKIIEVEDMITPFLVAPLYKTEDDILSVLERISKEKNQYSVPSYHTLQLLLDFTYHQIYPNKDGKKVYLSYIGEENFESFMSIANELSEKEFHVVTFPFGTNLDSSTLQNSLTDTFSDCEYIVQILGHHYPSAITKPVKHFNYIEGLAASKIFDTYLEEYSDFTDVPYNRVICIPEVDIEVIDDKQEKFNTLITSNKKLNLGANIFKGTNFEIKDYVIKNATEIDFSFKDLSLLDDETDNDFVYIISNPKNESIVSDISEQLSKEHISFKKQPRNFYNGSNNEHIKNIIDCDHLCIIGVEEDSKWISSNINIIRKHRLANKRPVNITLIVHQVSPLQDNHVIQVLYKDGYSDKLIDSIFIKKS